MKSVLRSALLVVFMSFGSAYASDDCHRVMADWQSREAVTTYVEKLGLASERLRIDDGCYEVRARDDQGNQLRLKIDPSTLAILKLEIRFQPGNDATRYLPSSGGQKGQHLRPLEGQLPAASVPSGAR